MEGNENIRKAVIKRAVSHRARPIKIQLIDDRICGRERMIIVIIFPHIPRIHTSPNSTPVMRNSNNT